MLRDEQYSKYFLLTISSLIAFKKGNGDIA